ncbi:MAG: hypothetical protein KIT16_11300 [Rhodospirillaceae bacterium]|nr:hypothetical protein [Rhodospirillaceae bacterium]
MARRKADIREAVARSDIERYRDHALALADEARRQLRALQKGSFTVETKSDGSPVTSADLAVEARLRALTLAAFPDHGQVGEEFPPHRQDADFQWVFDPVDGTEDFVHRVPTFGSLVGLFYKGEPLVGVIEIPMLEDRVHAAFGRGAYRDSAVGGNERLRLADLDRKTPAASVRVTTSAPHNYFRRRNDMARFEALARAYPNLRIYRSCYMHLCAATGQADAAIDYGNPIWDIAAARIVIEEAGGAFRLVDGYEEAGAQIYNVVFGRPAVVASIAKLMLATKVKPLPKATRAPKAKRAPKPAPPRKPAPRKPAARKPAAPKAARGKAGRKTAAKPASRPKTKRR